MDDTILKKDSTLTYNLLYMTYHLLPISNPPKLSSLF